MENGIGFRGKFFYGKKDLVVVFIGFIVLGNLLLDSLLLVIILCVLMLE